LDENCNNNKNKKKKMKKINPFSKKPKAPSHDLTTNGAYSVPGHTLDRLVCLKAEEKRKWELEKEEFDRRQREHEIHLLEIEHREVERREEEVRKRNDDLADKRRKNRLVQDKMQEQIKALEQKLLEFKVAHKKEEEDLEDNIKIMEDQLFEVKSDMEKRTKNLDLSFEPPFHHSATGAGADNNGGTGSKRSSLSPSEVTSSTMPMPSAPLYASGGGGGGLDDVDGGGVGEDGSDGAAPKYTSSMYPAIPVVTRSYETSKILQVGAGGAGEPVPPPRNSIGSSPKSSHSSERGCDTPNKTEHCEIDSFV